MESVINDKPNCSIHNPCGTNGYCVDNIDGEWSCRCKFWWNGTLCDEQTNSGKQVIALGCILGAFLIVFYGPFIILLLTFMLATLALIVKCSLLKPIHDTIIYQYKNNLPLYYVPNHICSIMSMNSFNVITFPVACCLILICIVITKRISLLPHQCHGYVAPPIPVDFLSHIDRKFASMIFAICADELFDIVRRFFSNRSSTNREGIILQYLERILEVVIIGLRYYPLLATVYLDTALALACGTIYAWLDFSITIANQAMCTSDYYFTLDEYNTSDNDSSLIEKLEYYGTDSQLLVLQLCTDIPRFLCLAYVGIKLPALLISKIYKQLRKDSLSLEDQILLKLTREERVILRASQPDSSEMLYLQNLFRSPDQRLCTQHRFGRLIPKWIYEWRDDFYFSARVLCVYSATILLIFFITVQACVQILPTLHSIQKIIQDFFDLLSSFDNTDEDIMFSATESKPTNSQFPVPNLERPYALAVVTTVLIIVVQSLVLLANIHRILLQSFRGDDSEIPRRKPSKYISYATGNMYFAGYFIGYLIWGYILIAVFASLLWISFEALIVYRNAQLLESILKTIIPSLLLINFKAYLNKILAQYVFLQHAGKVLAMKNRRISTASPNLFFADSNFAEYNFRRRLFSPTPTSPNKNLDRKISNQI
ncbi:unnamed protein product [Rotaria socialis]|uniref:EGF-like domain-containing protein n=2 Tax=Rotaria socialis TaxID=392032 RepID=A0A821FYT1_9BILA|nr:unnamed protein product [Rotaria socialis]